MTALRVYEPLEAFPVRQRPALAELAADPDAAQAAETAERLAAWRAVLGRRGSVRVRARVLRVEEAVLLCPSVLEVGDASPTTARHTGASVTGPDAAPSAGSGSVRRHSLVRAWELPVAWLSIVRREDLTRSGGHGRYVLPMSRARARAARTLRAVRLGLGESEITLDVEVLARWLELFHPRSWVEVDARPVAALVGGDDGAEDVRLGLECLTVGDAAGVAAAYQRMSKRSHRLEELSVSS